MRTIYQMTRRSFVEKYVLRRAVSEGSTIKDDVKYALEAWDVIENAFLDEAKADDLIKEVAEVGKDEPTNL